MEQTVIRPLEHLRHFSRQYPQAWRHAEFFRAARGKALHAWPEWCFLPMAGAYAIVSGGGKKRVPVHRIKDVACIAALAAWRMTKGIYGFDPTLAEAVLATELDRAIPESMFYRLPEWCVYVQAPDPSVLGCHGFFAHLEQDTNDGHAELRLLVDSEAGLSPIPLPLGCGSLLGVVEAMLEKAQNEQRVRERADAGMPELAGFVMRMISLVLYLCTEDADYLGGRRPDRPRPVRTKQGYHLFPAGIPAVWEMGLELGIRIRTAQSETVTQTGDLHAPRPPIRRARWHTFWTGPRMQAEKQVAHVQWLPPLPVGLREGEEIEPRNPEA